MADLLGILGDFFGIGSPRRLDRETEGLARGIEDALGRTVTACSEMASSAEHISDILKSAAEIGAFFKGGEGFSASRKIIERDSSVKNFFGGIDIGGGLAAAAKNSAAETARTAGLGALGALGTIGMLGGAANVFRKNAAGAYDITPSFGGVIGGAITGVLAALENKIVPPSGLFDNPKAQSMNSAAVIAALSVIGSVMAGGGSISVGGAPTVTGSVTQNSVSGILSGAVIGGKTSLFGGNIPDSVFNIASSVVNSVPGIGGGMLPGGYDRYGNGLAAAYLIGDVVARSALLGDVYGKVGERAELDRITSETSKISVNTEKSVSVSEISGEELKFLRDIAARDVINRFTTAQVSVSMGGVTNNLSGTADLDGIVDYLTNGVKTALENAAEGVHS